MSETDPTILEGLERLVDPVTCEDPQSPLRWTSKGSAKLEASGRPVQIEAIDIVGHELHSDWNCTVKPSLVKS